MFDTTRGHVDETEMAAAATAGDETAFTALTRRYRRELQVHCYRMLASFEDAQDLVQETFLRAWKNRATFEGRSSFRTWLYRIATNACLDFLERSRRRITPSEVHGAAVGEGPSPHIPWLQPYPDLALEFMARQPDEPDTVVATKETIGL